MTEPVTAPSQITEAWAHTFRTGFLTLAFPDVICQVMGERSSGCDSNDAPQPDLPEPPARILPMIVCSCSGVTDRDIHQAIAWMRASDPYAVITPGKIYRALGKSPQCGGCIRHFVERMRCDAQLAVPTGLRAPLRERIGVVDGG